MIEYGGKEIENIRAIAGGKERDVQTVYAVIKGVAVVVYEAIAGCFGLGYWRGDRPWKGAEGWRGNVK